MTRGLSIVKIAETGDEPVTLEELKAHLAIDFDDHDALLNSLLKSARQTVEKYCAVSLVETTRKARWEQLTTAEIPYGPVTAIVDESSYTIEGLIGDFPSIVSDGESVVTIEYTAGYVEVPEPLKLAIMKLATDNFSQRTGISIEGARNMNDWRKTAAPFSRKSWLA